MPKVSRGILFSSAVLFAIATISPLHCFGQGGPAYVSSAQTMTGDTMMPIPGGHDYIHMLGETVNPANGSVTTRSIAFPRRTQTARTGAKPTPLTPGAI